MLQTTEKRAGGMRLSVAQARLLAALCAIVLSLSFAVGSAWAAPASSSGGTGTESDPYLISNEADLAAMRDAINTDKHATSCIAANNYKDTAVYADSYWKLTDDIALTGPWTCIGLDSMKYYFSGHFDGAGHAITGLDVTSTSTMKYIGLFGYVMGLSNDVTITNLKVSGSVSTDGSNFMSAGGLIGQVKTGAGSTASFPKTSVTVSDCIVDVDVVGSANTGGLLGYGVNNVYIDNCLVSGDVEAVDRGTTAAYNVGGLVGNETSTGEWSVSNSLYTGQVTSSPLASTAASSNLNTINSLGGKVAPAAESHGIENCYAVAQVDSDVHDYRYSGGDVVSESDNTVSLATPTDVQAAVDKLNQASSATPSTAWVVNADGTIGLAAFSATPPTPPSGNKTLTYLADGANGSVTVTGSSPAATTETVAAEGTPAGATATAAAGYHFVNWTDSSDAVVSTSAAFVPAKPASGYVDATYTAHFAANVYTVKFDANDASATGTMSDMSITYGGSDVVPANAFSLTDNTFVKWNTKADGTGTDYAQGDALGSLTIADGGVMTLFAQWNPVSKATLTYAVDGNGTAKVTGSSPAATSETINVDGTPAGAKASAANGYHFVNWTDSSNVEVSTSATFVPAKPAGGYVNATYTAHFAANEFTIHFEPNAAAATGTMSDQQVVFGSGDTLTANAFERDGYEFNGWCEDAFGSGKSYTDEQLISNATFANGSTKTLYAQWKYVSKVTLTYASAGNGSVTVTGSNPPATFEAIVPTATPAGGTATADTGYHFVNWTNAANTTVSTSAAFVPSPVGGVQGTNTYTAHFAANTYTVKFNANDASATGSMSDMPITYGGSEVVPANAFTLANNVFQGWNTKADGTGTAYAQGAALGSLNVANGATVTLYAQWTPVLPVTLTYASAGNGTVKVTGSNPPKTSESILPTATAAGATATPASGYHFVKWTDSTNATVSTSATFVPTKPAGGYAAATYTAQFAANSYTVKFNANAAAATGTMSDMSVTFGESKTVPANAFVLANNVFQGWNTKADGTGTAYDQGAALGSLTVADGATVTLYAQWKATSVPPVSKVTLTYASAGNGTVAVTGSNPPATSESILPTATAAGATATPASGYHFVKWTNAANASVSTSAAFVPTAPAGGYATATYTAHFAANTYTVKFDANNASATGTMGDMSVAFGESKTVPANAFTLANNDFQGWNTKADGTGTAYAQGAALGSLNVANGATVTLYAQWKATSTPPAPPVSKVTLTYASAGNGTVAVTGSNPPATTESILPTDTAAGATATADDGYHFVNWTDGAGAVVSTAPAFVPTAPAGGYVAATYTAHFAIDEVTDPTFGFTDVINDLAANNGDVWYVSDGWLGYVVEHGLMTGYTDGSNNFGIYDSITRGQVATILYRYDQNKTADTTDNNVNAPYPDVASGAYYAAAVDWCAQQGIVTGYLSGDMAGTFQPEKPVTREELALMLARYVGWKQTGEAVPPAADNQAYLALEGADQVDDWAQAGVAYCCDKKILTGVDGYKLAPRDEAWRTAMAKMVTVVTRDII